MCANSPIAVQRTVRYQRERRSEEFGARLRDGRGGGELPAIGARARHGAEQAVQMPRDGVQPRALAPVRVRYRGSAPPRPPSARRKRRGFAEQQRIDGNQPPRLLIGGTAHHDAVDMVADARAPLRRRRCRH